MTYVEIVSYNDGTVQSRRGPSSERRADRIDDGLNINLNHEQFYTRMVEDDEGHFARLEELREALRAQNISWGELADLQGLAEFIPADDVELLEAAGVPEFVDN